MEQDKMKNRSSMLLTFKINAALYVGENERVQVHRVIPVERKAVVFLPSSWIF